MSIRKIHTCVPLMTSYRSITHSVKRFESKTPDDNNKVPSSGAKQMAGTNMWRVNKLDEWILTWTKRYPKGQVPEVVPSDVMVKMRTKARVKISNILMVIAALTFLGASLRNKRDAANPESERHKEWLAKLNRDDRRKSEASS